MNRDNTRHVMRLLTGLWPQPMSDDEASTWAMVLAEKDLATSADCIKAMAVQGSHWRPTPSEFLGEYKVFATHRPRPVLEPTDAPELEEIYEEHTVDEWRAIIRKQIQDSPGPRRVSLGASS